MRKDLLIASLIVLILGFVISGMIGTLLLTGGILLLLYVLFSRPDPRATEAIYHEPEIHKEPPQHKPEKKSAKYIEEPRPRYKNVDRAERELRAWGSPTKGKNCPSCGSSNNPYDAKFCADCGKRL